MGPPRGLMRCLHRHCRRLHEDEELGRFGDSHSKEDSGGLPAPLPEQRNADSGASDGQVTLLEHRVDAFARLFEAVHEGVYIGLLGPRQTTTLAANPHLEVMFGYPAEAREAQIRPFDAPRFVDPQARVAFIDRLTSEGAVTDYLLRLRKVDN